MQNGSDARLCLEHCKWLGSAPRSRKQKPVLKFVSQRDKALATIVLSVHPSVLYLIGDLEDPVVVWKKLSDQFLKKTWGNTSWCWGDNCTHFVWKRETRCKSTAMTEIFNDLCVIGEEMSEEDRVVYCWLVCQNLLIRSLQLLRWMLKSLNGGWTKKRNRQTVKAH